VQDENVRKQLQATVPSKNPSSKAITDAPKLLALCARKGRSGYIEDKIANKHGDWYMYDLGLMTQNLCLAAHSLGLGTVVVGWYDIDAAERILNCPDDVEPVTLIPMGYRAQKGHVPPHKPVVEFVHTNTF
jgi:nitroreductase